MTIACAKEFRDSHVFAAGVPLWILIPEH